MKKLLILASLIGLVFCLPIGPAHATLIYSDAGFPSGNLVNFSYYQHPGTDKFTNGPEVIDSSPTITFTSSLSANYSYLGNFPNGDYYLLGDNGSWGPGMSFAALNDATGTIKFAFSTPMAAVGAFMNYAVIGGNTLGTVTFAAYDQNNNLLDSYDISSLIRTGSTSNDDGRFLGIALNSPEISYFTLSNSYVVLTDLRYSETPVPIPGAAWLLGSGLLALVGLRKRFTT